MAETAEQRSRTVFVKGIAYGIEKDALEEAFAAVGPVRNCFIVRAKGEQEHKGYGYVQFALTDDAAAAIKQLQHCVLGGRKLKVPPWPCSQRRALCRVSRRERTCLLV